MTDKTRCPFCGGGNIQRNSDRWGHYFMCDCGARGPYGSSPADAFAQWSAATSRDVAKDNT